MSEHAEVAPVAFGEESLAIQARSPVVLDRGADWPLAGVFFAGVAALYAAVAVVIYLVATMLFL
jgi:hypothetical protein